MTYSKTDNVVAQPLVCDTQAQTKSLCYKKEITL